MKSRIILLLFSILIVMSCRYQKPLSAEKILFTNQNEASFYLISTIGPQVDGTQKSVRSLLVSEKNQSEKQSLSVFTNFVNGQSVASTITMIDSLTIFSKNRFPILLEGGRADSLLPPIRWKMSRSSIAASLGETGYTIKFNKQSPYKIHSVCKDPEIYSITPLTSYLKISNDKSDLSSSATYIHIFKNAGAIVKHPSHESLVWIDLQFNSQNFSCFFKLRRSDSPGIFFAKKDSVDLKMKSLEIKAESQGVWKSTASGKEYPLVFNLKIPGDSSIINIRPILNNQEIFMKQNSFWMGAIKVLDVQKGTTIGSGNMYIFK